MKAKVFKALDLLFESVFFLIVTYTLHSMYTSFKLEWYAIAFGAANICAITRYYERVTKITGSKVAATVALVVCWVCFAYLAYAVGYIRGEFTPLLFSR